MTLLIPINDKFSQTISVVLSNQSCQINIYQKATGLFCDLYVNSVLIIGGVICENMNVIVRDTYLGFVGDLMFYDTQGKDDPSSPGLGTRFVLLYLEASN